MICLRKEEHDFSHTWEDGRIQIPKRIIHKLISVSGSTHLPKNHLGPLKIATLSISFSPTLAVGEGLDQDTSVSTDGQEPDSEPGRASRQGLTCSPDVLSNPRAHVSNLLFHMKMVSSHSPE